MPLIPHISGTRGLSIARTAVSGLDGHLQARDSNDAIDAPTHRKPLTVAKIEHVT
jgi:hypothetical protein